MSLEDIIKKNRDNHGNKKKKSSGKFVSRGKAGRTSRRSKASPYSRNNKRNTKTNNNAKSNTKGEVSVYCGNIPWDCNWKEVKDLFKSFGCVHADVGEIRNGRNRGFAILKFETLRGAKNCMKKMNNEEVGGRTIFMKFDKATQKQRVSGDRNSEVSVYVGNIPWDCTWKELKDIFGPYGVTHADVGEKRDGRMRGFALLKFKNANDAEKAIDAMDGGSIDGRELVVRLDNKTNKQIFVGNIPWDCDWKQLKDAFKPYGAVHADVGESRNGKMRGFGIVKFESNDDAENAIQAMNGSEIGGREIYVKLDNESQS